MRLILDGRCVECGCCTVGELRSSRSDDAIALVNGRHVEDDHRLKDGDSVFFLEGGSEFVSKASGILLSERYTDAVYGKLSSARIGIAGLGGVGSHVAASLVRAGIGHLTIADFDRVDQTNLNRQNYYAEDIGRPKSEATRDRLLSICPDTDIDAVGVRIDEGNCRSLFSGCDVVCEAFDDPVSKSMLVESLLSMDDGPTVVSCSGMSGFRSSNPIVTSRRMERLYVCGDGVSDASVGEGLVSSRVMVCAGHVANMAIRIVLGQRDP